MPKLKTHKGTAKRADITAQNKVRLKGAGDKHFNEKKRSTRLRKIAIGNIVAGKIGKNIKRALGV